MSYKATNGNPFRLVARSVSGHMKSLQYYRYGLMVRRLTGHDSQDEDCQEVARSQLSTRELSACDSTSTARLMR